MNSKWILPAALASTLLGYACGHVATHNNQTFLQPISATVHKEPLPPFLPAATTQPTLCKGAYLTPDQGKAALQFSLDHFATSKPEWDAHVANVRAAIQRGAGLYPFPRKTPLHPLVSNRRDHDGYYVENVAFESIPGYYACCTLYHPLTPTPDHKLPAILNTHGHSKPATGGRFSDSVQQRCATLARMGAVAMSIEMFAYGDSLEQLPVDAHTKSDMAMPMQAWDNIRAVDFLSSLPDVDPHKIAVTGESGGGTQTFLLTALDPRIAVNVPCVMVSSYFFGGCACESGRPIHRDENHFTTNAEVASLFAPKPLLAITDGKDWTQHVPETEFPFLQKIYALEGAPDNVHNAHFPAEGHDFGPDKRLAMYRFMAQQFNLDIHAATTSDDKLDESHVTLEKPDDMKVWTPAHPLPATALHGVEAVRAELESLQSPVAALR